MAPDESERSAYEQLRLAIAAGDLANGQRVLVTGPLKQTDANEYQVHVRVFKT